MEMPITKVFLGKISIMRPVFCLLLLSYSLFANEAEIFYFNEGPIFIYENGKAEFIEPKTSYMDDDYERIKKEMKKSSLKPGSKDDIFPLSIGNEMVFVDEFKGAVNIEIIVRKEKIGPFEYFISQMAGEDFGAYRKTSKGTYLCFYDSRKKEWGEETLVIVSNPEVGLEWETGKEKRTITSIDKEVSSYGNTFNAIEVVVQSKETKDSTFEYYSYGFGLVEITGVIGLISCNLK
jgi:hypothetical protein